MKTIISTKKTCETSVLRFDSDYSKMSDVEPYVDNFVPDRQFISTKATSEDEFTASSPI